MTKIGFGLHTNDSFPSLGVHLISGERIQLPDYTGESYGVFLIYRGHWWPFCNQQLADFQSIFGDFESEGIKIVAGSVDSVEKAKKYNLPVPLIFLTCS